MGEVVERARVAPASRTPSLLRVTDVVCAVLVVSLLPWVRAGLPRGAWREVVVWATVRLRDRRLGRGVRPHAVRPRRRLHRSERPDAAARARLSSIASDTVLYVGVAAAWLATRRTGPAWFRRTAWWLFWGGGVRPSVVFRYFDSSGEPGWAVGVAQRVHILCISAWIVALAVYAATVGLRARSQPVQASGQNT